CPQMKPSMTLASSSTRAIVSGEWRTRSKTSGRQLSSQNPGIDLINPRICGTSSVVAGRITDSLPPRHEALVSTSGCSTRRGGSGLSRSARAPADHRPERVAVPSRTAIEHLHIAPVAGLGEVPGDQFLVAIVVQESPGGDDLGREAAV